MYKLAIVEDETDVRKRIASLIARACRGFEIAGEYETGIDAYEGIIAECPDMILTDIKIPYINGIDLVKKVREVHPLVKLGIITGYNEFDYAREAANLGVLGFISKPVTFDAIDALLQKAEAVLDREFLTTANLSGLEAFYKDSLPILREYDLQRLSAMPELSPSFTDRLKSEGVRLDYPYFVMCVFDIDEASERMQERYELALSSIRKTIGEDFTGAYHFELFNRPEGLCLLLKFEERPDVPALELHIEEIIQRTGRYSDMPVSAGISGVYENSRNFAAMVREAARALEYRRVMGGGKVFFFGNANAPRRSLSVSDSFFRDMDFILHCREEEEYIALIDKISESIDAQNDTLYYAATSALNAAVRACDNLEGLYGRCGGLDDIYRRLFACKTNREISAYLKNLGGAVRELNDDAIADNVERSLRKVTGYMRSHFRDPDISFETLAREVNFSVGYISALLKKRLNTSFVKMLTSLRMEEAKKLLSDPNMRIIDVAEQLGYNDAYYFSHCFKKYVGISPKEYRKI